MMGFGARRLGMGMANSLLISCRSWTVGIIAGLLARRQTTPWGKKETRSLRETGFVAVPRISIESEQGLSAGTSPAARQAYNIKTQSDPRRSARRASLRSRSAVPLLLAAYRRIS